MAEREEQERRRQADLQAYQAACPVCKWCGYRYNFNNSGFFEYCSRKCAISDIGKNKIEEYSSFTGLKNLSMKLNQLISQRNALSALILADGIQKFTLKQNLYLAKEYTNDHPCIAPYIEKAFSFLESAYNTMDAASKAEMIQPGSSAQL